MLPENSTGGAGRAFLGMRESCNDMRVRCPSTDIISDIPPNIIEMILTLMPIRDAMRTSILSRKWRYNWAKIPKLVFDYKLLKRSTDGKLSEKGKVFQSIYQVLLVHRGPLIEFKLSLPELESYFEIHQIMLNLSWNNTVEKFTLFNTQGDPYKLPLSFFSLERLTCLDLRNISFRPPSTFKGFSRLTWLRFQNVYITAKILLLCISTCQQLKSLTLGGAHKHFTGESQDFNFVELFKCLPMIEELYMDHYPYMFFAASGVPQKLPTLLVYLRIFSVSRLCFAKVGELSSTLCLIRSSPNLEKIKLQMYVYEAVPSVSQALVDFLELQEYSDVSLDHLKELEMKKFSNLMPEWEFLKLILAKSPMLKKVRIELDQKVSADEEMEMLRDLVRLPLPRASPEAEFIIERPKVLVKGKS